MINITRRKTHEEFVSEIYNLVGNEYEILDKYIDCKTKIKIKHNVCDYEFNMVPSNFLSGQRCPKCSHQIPYTVDVIKEKVFDLTNDEYEVLNVYKSNNGNKILMKHNVCGYEWNVLLSNFIGKGSRCPKCANRLRFTTEYFKELVFNLVGSEYNVLEEYINMDTKIKMIHNLCGNIYEVAPYKFLNNRRCPKCFGKFRKTTEKFKQEVYNLVNNEYGVLEDYISNHTKISIKHNKCGFEYSVTPGNFLLGKRCPKCANHIPYTTETFKEKLYELFKDEYELLSEYNNSITKMLIKHNLCGHEWYITPNHFIFRHSCPICTNKNIIEKLSKTHKQFLQEVYDLVKNEYKILGNYKNSKTHIEIKHNTCGYIWNIIPSNFLKGRRCPKCAESKGEQKIRHWLEDNNIKFDPQYTFDKLVGQGNGLLRFDFGILNKNNELEYLIEYDGEYHYLPIEGEEILKYQQYHDQLKNQYCKDNNISPSSYSLLGIQ